MAAKPQSVIIADDHHLVVHSVRLLVEETLGLTCIATVHDGVSCVESASEHKPDLVILDLELPRLRGDDAIKLLKQVSPASKILVITANTIPRVLRGVWEAGVHGIALKGSPVNEICEAIRTVLSGQRYIARRVSANFCMKSLADKKLESLTDTEREMFELLVQRVSINSVSTHLNVSTNTIKNHEARIMAKLDVQSRADLVAFAVESGFQDLILKTSLD